MVTDIQFVWLLLYRYYFRGDIANVSDYIDPSIYVLLTQLIDTVKDAIAVTNFTNTAMWIGETADSWHGGTPNCSDRFVSGFL